MSGGGTERTLGRSFMIPDLSFPGIDGLEGCVVVSSDASGVSSCFGSLSDESTTVISS